MAKINDIIMDAERLKKETMVGSIDPQRLGQILCSTLECLQELSEEIIPAFDILTSRTRRNVILEGSTTLYDYFPIIRLKGDTVPANCIIEVYRYENRGNKRYKRILSASMSNCEAPEKWIGGGYRSIMLPWSLQRIFWEVWDPGAAGGKMFHINPYNPSIVYGDWIEVCQNGYEVAKYNDSIGVPRTAGPIFTASFGVRIINSKSGSGGNMKTFRISLIRNTKDILRFSLKIDAGTTVVST